MANRIRRYDFTITSLPVLIFTMIGRTQNPVLLIMTISHFLLQLMALLSSLASHSVMPINPILIILLKGVTVCCPVYRDKPLQKISFFGLIPAHNLKRS